MAATPDPRRVGVLTICSHVIMVAGIIAIAVGDELVIQHPLGHPESAWTVVILGGPALFLAGRATFEYAVFGRVSAARAIGALALLALTPAMRPIPLLAAASTAALILAGVAVADALRSRKRPSEGPSAPGWHRGRADDVCNLCPARPTTAGTNGLQVCVGWSG